MVYSVSKHFPWFQNHKLYWFSDSSQTNFFNLYQTILVNTWHEPTAYDEIDSREQRIQLISLLAAKRYVSSL